MGWCSATPIFDAVAGALLSEQKPDVEHVLRVVINALEDGDWDCQEDSAFWDHPTAQKVMRELHPSWFEEPLP